MSDKVMVLTFICALIVNTPEYLPFMNTFLSKSILVLYMSLYDIAVIQSIQFHAFVKFSPQNVQYYYLERFSYNT